MIGLIGWLVSLAGLMAAWTLVLWFAIRPDVSAATPLAILAGHLLPPLLAWSVAFWGVRHRRERRRLAAEADQAARTQAAAESAQAQQRAHAAALEQRRYRIAVLAAVLGGWPSPDEQGGIAPAAEAVSILSADCPELPDDPAGAPWTADGIWQQIIRALDEIYALCPGAQAFPVRVQVPAAWRNDVWIAQLAAHAADARRWVSAGTAVPGVEVAWLPDSPHLADALFALFDDAPRLPGVVVVAADSRLGSAHAPGDSHEPVNSATREHRRWHGAPAQGVAALALANPHLAGLIGEVESCRIEADRVEMTNGLDGLPAPFWATAPELPADLQALAALTDEVRAMLRASFPLAFLHRATAAQCQPRAGRIGELAQVVRRALEQSLVNAGLLAVVGEVPAGTGPADAPGGDHAQAADAQQPSGSAPGCDWLVHNAGGIDCAGQRLAAVSLAMHTLGVDLNPIDDATNITTGIGDLGLARPMTMLAQAVNQCAARFGPVCWVDFGAPPPFQIGIVTPGASPDRAAAGAA